MDYLWIGWRLEQCLLYYLKLLTQHWISSSLSYFSKCYKICWITSKGEAKLLQILHTKFYEMNNRMNNRFFFFFTFLNVIFSFFFSFLLNFLLYSCFCSCCVRLLAFCPFEIRNQRNQLTLDNLSLSSPERYRSLRHQHSTDNMYVAPFNIPNLRIEQRKTSSAEDMARKNSTSKKIIYEA